MTDGTRKALEQAEMAEAAWEWQHRNDPGRREKIRKEMAEMRARFLQEYRKGGRR